ncbi:MAG TPA: MAPEG family protein [Polyangiales bacterium]
MEPIAIFRPVVALVALTALVLGRIPYVRFRAGRRRQVTFDDFRFGESPQVPPEVVLPNRNLMNLLELPILFYVLALALYVTQRVDGAALAMAWAYVALRAMHSLVHLTINVVPLRLVLFALSNGVLLAMWLRFALQIS